MATMNVQLKAPPQLGVLVAVWVSSRMGLLGYSLLFGWLEVLAWGEKSLRMYFVTGERM